jgi:guanine nucleotide-binding protein subunit beta-2-like 1 protein
LVARSSFLYSAGSDSVVKQWNISSGALTADFVGHINYISSLQLDGDFLLSGSWDLSIKKWNIESTVIVESIGGNVSPNFITF